MSGNPHKLKATLLEQADTESQREFARMLAEQCAEADLRAKGHRCLIFIPSPSEYERMKKYTQPPDYDRCPKCKEGRVKLLQQDESFTYGLYLVCQFSKSDCDFRELISDPE